jgi:hypothetical protein
VVVDAAITELANTLQPDEPVVDAIAGRAITSYGSPYYMLVLTPTRALKVWFSQGGLFKGPEAQVERNTYWQDIASVSVDTYRSRRIDIVGKTGSESVGIDYKRGSVAEQSFARFAQRAQQILDAHKRHASAPPSVAISETQFIDELERLGALKERGMLTAEEFTLAKRKLLGP